MTEGNNIPGKKETTKSKKKASIRLKKFDDLEGKFLLVKVGTDDEPALPEQIDDIQKKLVDLFEKNGINCLAFVTHHAVEMSIIEKNGA